MVLTDNKSLTRFFQAKTIPSSLWTCVDHVLNFNFLLGHIPGKANAAADYLSRIHIQPHTKLELKFNSKIPVADVHLNMGMQVPDNSVNLLKVDCELLLGHIPGKANAAADYLSRIHIQPHTKLELKFNSKIPVADVHLNMGMQVPDNSVNLLKVDCELLMSSENLKASLPSINALHAPNPLDHLDMSDRLTPLNLQLEQQKDTNIKLVLAWLANRPPSPSPYMNTELRKYLNHFARLENHYSVLYRKFFSDNGRDFIRQYVVTTHLREELLYRVHNSKYAGHPGIAKTAELFRKKLLFSEICRIFDSVCKKLLFLPSN